MAYTEFDGELDGEAPGYVEFSGELDKPESSGDRIKSVVSKGVSAGLSMLTPKKSIADQAQEQSSNTGGLAAPQVRGVPIRQDYYNKAVAEPVKNPAPGIVSRVQDVAANDTKAQRNKNTVSKALVSGEPVDESNIGLLGTLKEGSKGTARNIGAAIDTVQGNAGNVISASQDAAHAEKDPALESLLSDINARKKALGKNPGWLDSIKAVGGAALNNPKGAGLLVAEQLPNSATALGAGAAGMAAGSVFGPAGAVAGGIAGLFGANTALETGGKAIEAATDGTFSPAEQSRVLKEGTIKGGVVTGIDAATLGLTNFIMGTTARAVERATVKTLADNGVDVSNKAAVLAATKDPAIAASVKSAQDLAQKASTTLGQKLARVGGATGLETVGEGAGEYLGEMAATGKADKVDAVIEALSSLGQSAGEIAFTAARNKARLATILGKPATEQSDGVLKYTAERGGKKAKEIAQAELERRAKQGVDTAVANAPESTPEAVQRIIATGKDKADDIRGKPTESPDAIQSSIFDEEPGHIVDANKKVSAPDFTQEIKGNGGFEMPIAEVAKKGDGATSPWLMPDGTIIGTGQDHISVTPEGDYAQYMKRTGAIRAAFFHDKDNGFVAMLHKTVGQRITPNQLSAIEALSKANNGKMTIQVGQSDKQLDNPEYHKIKLDELKASATQPDAPTPEPVETLNAQLNALADGRKPGVLITPGEPMPDTLPPSIKSADVPGHGTLLYRDDATLQAARNGQMGTALGYGIDEKPAGATHAVTARDEKGNVIQDVATDGSKSVLQAAKDVAGPGGTVEVRPVADAIVERSTNTQIPTQEQVEKASAQDETQDTKTTLVQSEPGPKPVAAPKQEKTEDTPRAHPIRPLLESLIKRRAAAKQVGKERSINNAIARAKEVMNGKRADPDLESKWFRLQAGAIRKSDPATADLLHQISETIKPLAKQKSSGYDKSHEESNQKKAETKQTIPVRGGESAVLRERGGRILANGIVQSIQTHGISALIGKTINSPEQLAEIAQVYRNPRYETFRIFFTKGIEIVHASGVTARLPGTTPIFPKDMSTEQGVTWIKDMMQSSGADGYWMLHNHPSGNPTPSDTDITATRNMAKLIPGFKGHVIINSNKYAQIMIPNSRISAKVISKHFSEDNLLKASKPSVYIGKPVPNPSVVATIGKSFQKDGWVTLIGVSGLSGVRSIAEIPSSTFTNPILARAALRRFARRTGAESLFAYGSASDLISGNASDLITEGFLRGAVDEGGKAHIGKSKGKSFGKTTGEGGIQLEQSNAPFNPSWNSPEPSKLDNLIYTLQNKHVDLKRVVAEIQSTSGKLADQWNTYLQEELFHGRAAKRTQDFVNRELKPIMMGMKLRGQSIDELDKYLHARHAEEANNLIASRDPNMPDGGSGMTTQDAKDYLANLPADKRKALENTARQVDAVIAKTRDTYLSYGLIDQDTADSWKNMFKHYVPLMREDNDGGMGIGQGFSIKGKEAKHRTGSKRKVVDILANIALQRERAIVRGEKNRVAVSLAGLAKLNPNPDFWTFENVPQRHYNEKTGLVEERADPLYKERKNVVVAKIKDSKGNIQEKAIIFQEDNDRAMRMAAAMKNLDATQLEGLFGVSAAITRYFAAINTQYNPVFGVVNLIRDLQAALLNLSSTAIAGHKAQVLKNILPAISAIYASTRGARQGKQSNSPMGRLWDEMQNEGGMTGYRDLFKTSEDRANAIKRELDPTAWMNNGLGKIFTAGGTLKVPLAVAQKKAKWLFDWLSDYNQTLEGAMRLSVYKVAIDNGVSKPQGASIAKNISVNFNRKGQSGQQAGALYAFFNAAMQGTARMGETMTTMEKGDPKTFRFNRAGKTIIAGGISLGVIQALALAAAGFDDDEPPEFVRERSLIIPIGDKKYITIPMPLGFHAIPNIGRLSTEYALGGFKKPATYTAKLFSVFAEAFNPIGNAGMSIQTLAPTAIDPLVALAENRDWTGRPIAKEDFHKLSPTPGFTRNKDTASDPSKWIAEAINTISGGNKYVPGVASPTADQIDYLFGQVTGGVGREAGKAQQSIKALSTGEDLPPHKIPLVGRFYGNSEGQSSQGNAFYSNLKRINEVEAELEGRHKDKLPLDEFKAENPEYRLVKLANMVERSVSKQRKLKSDLIKHDAPREQVKAVEDRITQLMSGFNGRVRELKQAHQTAH